VESRLHPQLERPRLTLWTAPYAERRILLVGHRRHVTRLGPLVSSALLARPWATPRTRWSCATVCVGGIHPKLPLPPLPFEDRFPAESPSSPVELAIGSTTDVEGARTDRPHAPTTGIERHPALYRLGFKAVEVPGFPDAVRIGAATVAQTPGPVRTQRTHIAQRPGWRPRFIKAMDHVEVGHRDWLTICQLEVRVPADVPRAMTHWHSQALAAVAVLAALLDERVAQDELFEDLLVFDAASDDVIAVFDHVARLRTFQGANAMLRAHHEALAALSTLDLAEERAPLSASRWYLRAAQLGPVADAVVFFWIALEALSKPPFGTRLTAKEQRRTDVKWVEDAIEDAGLDPADVNPSVGRLAGLRAEIVHGGVEQPALLYDGYYALEQIVRLLLRRQLGLQVGWPLAPDESNLRDPWKLVARRLHKRRTTEWIEGTT